MYSKMTVITKAIIEKKADKMEQPLVIEDDPVEVKHPKEEQQAQKSRKHRCFVMLNVHHGASPASCLLFLIALTVLIIGVYCGVYMYTHYARPQMYRFRTGWYNIPYESANKVQNNDAAQEPSVLTRSEAWNVEIKIDDEDANTKQFLRTIGNFFKERFEMDLENDLYEKIEVPDFRCGRQGRFIHDFNINKTGIIDIDGKCCFVMPLNRQRVLPPRNMYDLLKKMYNGDYEIDTEIVRETMKVVTPPITDLSVVGAYIARECQDLPTYMLRKVNPDVVKRSASSGVFGQFAGKSITEIDILNLDAVQAYTEHTPN